MTSPAREMSGLLAFTFALMVFPGAIATGLACLALRQWGRAAIAGGFVLGMVVGAFWKLERLAQ